MDGLEDNEGLIVIATTNDVEAIEPALKDRPSRFDVVLQMGLPSEDQRRQILNRLFRTWGCGEEFLEWASKETNGLSGAQVREVAFLAMQAAIVSASSDAVDNINLRADDLAGAIDTIKGMSKRSVGF
jgi:transitional endoplasmic reticulum ATPase